MSLASEHMGYRVAAITNIQMADLKKKKLKAHTELTSYNYLSANIKLIACIQLTALNRTDFLYKSDIIHTTNLKHVYS